MDVHWCIGLLAYLILVIHTGRSDGGSCKRTIRNLKPLSHSTKQVGKSFREVTIMCDKGYSTRYGKTKTILRCRRGKIRGGLPKCTKDDFSKCGRAYYKPVSSRGRIVGGSVSKRQDWPWAVRIYIKGKHFCGGSLISDKWVLTAAHCFKQGKFHPLVDPKSVSVGLQGINRTNVQYYIHEKYDVSTYKNDIALIKISKFKYDPLKQRICLMPSRLSKTFLRTGGSLHAVGWGGTQSVKRGEKAKAGHYAKQLKHVEIPFIPDSRCSKKVKDMQRQGKVGWYFSNKTQFCAGSEFGGNDTCHGDSGGPAMAPYYDPVKKNITWYQIGVVSWGHGCAQKGEYGYYTKVSAYLDWINKRIREIRCSSPPVLPPNSQIILSRNFKPFNGVKRGARLSLTCKPGYVGTGKNSVLCNAKGQWEIAKTFKCKLIQQPRDYSQCGQAYYKPANPRGRIVGGQISNANHWPWAVKIIVRGRFRCGGTLISKELVLTAAHCVVFGYTNTLSNQIEVTFGKPSTTYVSRDYYVHPGYDYLTFENDIALIKIPELKRFTRNQQMICLPRAMNTKKIIKKGNSLFAIGWGTTKPVPRGRHASTKDYSKDLKQVRIPFQENKVCDDRVNRMRNLGRLDWYFNSTTQFCAGDTSGKNDTCRGDGGGPGMILHTDPASNTPRWYQVGIASWGYGCAQKGEYGYYTKVSAFLTWIDQW